MGYQTPVIKDHGSISAHTYTRAGGGTANPDLCQGKASPPKDWYECKLDCFSEWSCS